MKFIDLTGKGDVASQALGNFAKSAIMIFENNIFSKAEELIEQYNGGQWSVGTVDGQYVMFIDSDKKVTALTAYDTVETDLRTASFAAYYIMVNAFSHHYATKNQALSSHFVEAWFKLRDIAFGDENVLNLDTKALFNITD